MIILQKDTTMEQEFSALTVNTIFFWASWYWVKINTTKACTYDKDARKITGNPMVIKADTIVKVI